MTSNINFMINSEELKNLIINDKNIILIDVREFEEYSNGHIIHAVNFPEIFTYLPEGLTTDTEKDDFNNFYKDIFSKAGISPDDTVVFYEDKFTLMSPRGLAILKYLGHKEEKIKVLEGGYYSWCQNNFETTNDFIENKSTNFTLNIDNSFFVDFNEMIDIVQDDSTIVLDVRDKDEWIGISSSPYGINFAPKKGRIPNSVWIEWYDFITSDMLSIESLEKIQLELDKKGIKEEDKIVLYCFKGARLSNSYIALRKLGYKNIRIYFAGWNEWCRKENAPIINEVENTNNPILQENIRLKNKLDELNVKQANLIDFPKYNKQAIFAFNRNGEICSANEAKRKHLANIVKIEDIIPDFKSKEIYNMIDNNQEKHVTITVDSRYYSINLRGSRDSNKILVYCYDNTKNMQNEKLLFEQSKMISMAEMIGNLAHQWRQPLSTISTAATGAKLKKEFDILSDEDFNYAMDSINHHSQYLSQTIEELKSFLNPNDTKEHKFLLSKAVDKALALIQFESIDIQIIQNIDEISIVSLENEYIKIFLTLLNNAKDALNKLKNKRKLIFINIYSKEKELYIEIKDNAKGIKEEIIDRVFEPYFTTKHQSQGTGLGLYTCQDIIKNHLNGTIDIENETYNFEGIEYTGAKFIIKLKR